MFKTALITGGSSGIGLALARQLAAEGTHVTIIGRRKEQLETALQDIRKAAKTGDQVFDGISVDVADFSAVEQALLSYTAEVGVPDLLVNSAGIARPGLFEELPVDVFRAMMDINYFGTVHTCRILAPQMIMAGRGHIANISSVVGFLGLYGYTAYGASKFAVRGFTDALRAELKLHGVHVSIVFPPDTQTPQLDEENRYKPAITKAIAGSAGVMSADKVAADILSGLKKHRYMILPGIEGKLIFSLTCLLGELVYPVMDWMVNRAKKQTEKLST